MEEYYWSQQWNSGLWKKIDGVSNRVVTYDKNITENIKQ